MLQNQRQLNEKQPGCKILDYEKLKVLFSSKYHSLEDAKDFLGEAANISKLFIEFQKHLYEAKVA